jgi:DNA invertase Pin-like site-specific DNA recombinase
MSTSFGKYAAAEKATERNSNLRVVGYTRVSTQEQRDSGAGLQAQRSAIEAEAARRAWQLVAIHEDSGVSGKSLSGRPGLLAALEAVERGEASALVVSKLDRLSRSVVDFAGLVARAQRRGWALVALDLGLDMTTPAGGLVANVMASVAEWERRVIGERTAAALAARRAAGVRLGRPREIPPAVIARIHELRSSGLSIAAIARRLNAEAIETPRGGRWHSPGVKRVLSWVDAQ